MSEVASTASPLADSFQRCARSFKELYLALFAYGPISLSKFIDEYGRFGVWGGDSGADRTGRGSLDDVLRNDPRTTSIIAELLENLTMGKNGFRMRNLQYLRSASKKTAAETESSFYPWDLAHIIEKRQFWINQQKWDAPAEKNKAEDT
ncbi:hypothetical protein V501_02082 [Pseudogymnoascus sp. VKM F-4519 (FW-2642)]|nr:hypothetical protein V501_02082 [Pseudogymnoascus sp. VKM F-4519 (FW-2642)]